MKIIRMFFAFFISVASMYGLGEDMKTFRSDFVQIVKSDDGQQVIDRKSVV